MINSSYIFAFIYLSFYLKEVLTISRRESKTLILYIFIILGIVVNDIYVGADSSYMIKSILLHIFSLALFIFFLSLFLKDEFNFPKFLIIFSIALVFYKNQEYLLNFSRVLDSAYFNSRLASLTLYFSIGILFESYFFKIYTYLVSINIKKQQSKYITFFCGGKVNIIHIVNGLDFVCLYKPY